MDGRVILETEEEGSEHPEMTVATWSRASLRDLRVELFSG